MSDRQIAFQRKHIERQNVEIERLKNQIHVLQSRNKTLRTEVERYAHGDDSAWGQWQQCDAGVFGDGRVVGHKGTHLVFVNDRYQVAIFRPTGRDNVLSHLSIKRRDGAAVHDWRDFQRIKNELLDPEYEAVELYPAESRLVDGANQYHLFAIAGQFPFGFTDRLVSENEDGGVQQRAFGEGKTPDDLQTITVQAMAEFAGLED